MRDIKFAVFAKVYGSAIVVRGAAQVVEIKQVHFTVVGVGDVAAVFETAHAVMNRWCRRRVKNLYVLITLEVRIEGVA